MKSAVPAIFLSILFVLLSACNKETSNADTKRLLLGEWELRKVQSGKAPVVEYPAGNGNTLLFTTAGYKMFVNGQLNNQGSYTIINDTTAQSEVCLVLQPGEYQNRIVYDKSESSKKVFLQISGDTLTFLSGCFAYDGGTYKEYRRK